MSIKLEEPENKNYAAQVVTIHEVHPLDGMDRVQGASVLGLQAIVGLEVKPGDRGIVFGPETQLSQDYTYFNNLHRHGDRNVDQSVQGYLEDNRRVRAIKLRGHRSDALFMPLESLDWATLDYDLLPDGAYFDKIGDHPICNKYVVRQPKAHDRAQAKHDRAFRRVDKIYLPEHVETDNYFYYGHVIPDFADVVVTQKLHGTSVRLANTVVKRKLTWLEKLAKKVGIKVAETEFDFVAGSRKVIKDPNNPYQNDFYGTDIWTEALGTYSYAIPENFIVYGELVGWVDPGKPIQKNYTYEQVDDYELYVYRVTVVTHSGRQVDLSWDAVRRFTDENGLKHVPELWRGRKEFFDPEKWLDIRFLDTNVTHRDYPVRLSNKDTVDEGVAIRYDGAGMPQFFKAKSPIFLAHETKLLDRGEVDTETQGNEQPEEILV